MPCSKDRTWTIISRLHADNRFVGNFFLTSWFTFRTTPSFRRFLGFAGSHGLNSFLHIALFNVFFWLGVHRLVAPPLVMLVAMLVQFTILRFIFAKKA